MSIAINVLRPVVSGNRRGHYWATAREVKQTALHVRGVLSRYDAERPIALPARVTFTRFCRRRFDTDRLAGSPTLTSARDTVTRWLADGQRERLTDSPAHAHKLSFIYEQELLQAREPEYFVIEIRSLATADLRLEQPTLTAGNANDSKPTDGHLVTAQ